MKNNFISILFLVFIFSCSHVIKNPIISTDNKNLISKIPFELLDNRMFVEVMINGQGPFKFVFDTGGSNCMTPEVAEKLNLPMKPIEEATGAGENSVKTWKVQTNSFQIGNLKLSSQEFMVIDFSPIKKAFAFPAFDGIFGYEFLQKYSAKIDFVEHQIYFFTPDTITPNQLNPIPFTLVADKPVISAKINNLYSKILIDTGDRSALTIFSNFRNTGSIKRIFEGKKSQITGYGIGGPIPALLSKIDSLEMNSQTQLKNIIARAPVTKGGFNAIANINASIGNEILRQFDVTFDYRNKLIYLIPNKFFGENTKFNPIPHLE